jgi:hypothetical protein
VRRSIPKIAWLLLGILALAASLISLSKRQEAADPRIDSYAPSGLAAFADLLRQNGYKVDLTLSNAPRFRPGDVVVACINEQEVMEFSGSEAPIFGSILRHVEHGGRLLVLPYDPDFSESAATANFTTAHPIGDEKTRELQARSVYLQDAGFGKKYVSLASWQEANSRAAAWLTKIGEGFAATPADGYVASNRFIGAVQNADFLMSLVASLAPKGSHIVFAENTFQPENPSVLEAIGPGAVAAWWQVVFLFLVIVFTLGKRFGLPEAERSAQSGQRELVNAVADTYQRARLTQAACKAAYDKADAEIRKALKLSSDAPPAERDQRIPEILASRLRQVYEGSIDPLTPREAFVRCKALREEQGRFLQR